MCLGSNNAHSQAKGAPKGRPEATESATKKRQKERLLNFTRVTLKLLLLEKLLLKFLVVVMKQLTVLLF